MLKGENHLISACTKLYFSAVELNGTGQNCERMATDFRRVAELYFKFQKF